MMQQHPVVLVLLLLVCAQEHGSLALMPAGAISGEVLTTVVGPPEVVGGPTCCMFDSPFTGVQVPGTEVVVAYTSNSQSYVWSRGASVSDQLATPIFTGLGPDEDANAYSHCGKWINAAWADAQGVVHAFYHQEWNCDYAKGGYTNKSVAYAVSKDGGITFTPEPMPSPEAPGANQIIAGANFSAQHQTGEGDHNVFQLGDYLYLVFIEWDGPSTIHGGTTAGIARAAVADAGRPGSWFKYFNGSFSEPGVGGRSDFVNVPGSAVYPVPDVAQLISIGVIFSSPLAVAWCSATSEDGPVDWKPAASGPMFNADWCSWNRNSNSSELFGYPSLIGPEGSNTGIPSLNAYVYFTYLAPGTDFTQRYMVRRPLEILVGDAVTPALAALSIWVSGWQGATRFWPTSGPITPPAGYNVSVATLAYLATSAAAPGLVPLRECLVQGGGSQAGPESEGLETAVVLTRDGECGQAGTPFASGSYLRTPGWAATSEDAANALGWASVQQPSTGRRLSASGGELVRCIGSGTLNYTVTFNDPACGSAGSGWRADVALGYALSPLA